MPGSATDITLVNKDGEPDQLSLTDVGSYSIQCSYCDGSVPRVIAEHCEDCDLHFHPGHYQSHRDEWPCPHVDSDLCRWCEKHIEEHDNVMVCTVCVLTTHTECYAAHCPCPDGWTKRKLGNRASAEDEPPVTPPSGPSAEAAARLADLHEEQAKLNAKIQALKEGQNYPQSPGPPGATKTSTVGAASLANLGVAPGATMHSGSVVQYGKIKEADTIKLLAFPKPGTSFDRWLDHAIDAVPAATTYVNEAFKWIRMIKKSDTTFEMLADSGNFLRLDAILLTALMECIPGDTHYLRQEIKKAKTLQQDTKELNITGRQVLFLVYHFFSMSEKDRGLTDTARVQRTTLHNGDISQFIYKWDECLQQMKTRPDDDYLMNIFVLQFQTHLPKTHVFYVEWLLWYNRPIDDPIRSYDGIWRSGRSYTTGTGAGRTTLTGKTP